MDPSRLIERLTSADADAASATEIPGLFSDLRRLTGWASSFEAKIARRASGCRCRQTADSSDWRQFGRGEENAYDSSWLSEHRAR